ncbi:MAG TPA: methyltransferase domain-containing protein [Acidimicrobiales bacterium]|jgi:ubiquinone/menaquinone biosynthesis C-methylase UbiE|nr:methyltransferase domain-containing protein [Acidimicrobiales bacterium]
MSEPSPYLHGHHESVLRSHRWRTAENSAAYLLPHLHPGASLLDVGCGPATITSDFVQLVASGRVVGLDTSEAVLDLARDTVGDTAVEFRRGDVMALPFDDGEFDVVHGHQVLQHLVDPVGALREMARVCRSGGVVAARDADFPAMSWYPHDPDLDEWLALYLRVAYTNGTEPAAGRQLLGWANEVGFEEVTASASTWCYATDELRQWWGTLWADRMTHSEVARRSLELEYATPSDLERIADAWRRWGSSPDGWFVVVNCEILARPGSAR